jgi:hypothetical protein
MEPKIHYRFHNGPPLVSVLTPMNTVHAVPAYFLKIFVLSFHIFRGLTNCLFPSWCPFKSLHACTSIVSPYSLHSLLILSSLIWPPNNVWWELRGHIASHYTILSILPFRSSVRLSFFSQQRVVECNQLVFFLWWERSVSHQRKAQEKIAFLYILIS